MAVFRHPHLTRGIVRTPKGAFEVSRGLVDVPDELGEALGWMPVDTGDGSSSVAPAAALEAGSADQRRARVALR